MKSIEMKKYNFIQFKGYVGKLSLKRREYGKKYYQKNREFYIELHKQARIKACIVN